jgi:Homeodomain-like domain
MTARERARANALGLRASGLSIRQIADRLGVPKGTVGDWVRGRGEWYEVRGCELCGERFIPAGGRQRFCSRQHAVKHRRVFGPPAAIDVYRDRARELEAELAALRTELDARTIDAYRDRARALEGELAALRGQLDARMVDAYRERARELETDLAALRGQLGTRAAA